MVFGPWRALSTSSRTAEGAPRTWPVLRAARRRCRRGAALSWGPSVDARGVAERRRLRGAGDGRLPAHAARGRQQHARLFARTRHGAARERGEGLRRRGRPRDADARQRGVPPRGPRRPGAPLGADTRRFTVGDRIYRANGRSVLRKLDSGDGREDQPVVGGTTAVAPRATYTITSAAERAITTAAAH